MTKPRNWKRCELKPIERRPGGFEIDPVPQKTSDKRAKLIGKGPAHLLARSVK